MLAAPSRDSELTITMARGLVVMICAVACRPSIVRHVDVHGDDIGLQRFRQAHGFAAIFGVADDLKLFVGD